MNDGISDLLKAVSQVKAATDINDNHTKNQIDDNTKKVVLVFKDGPS